MFDWRSFSTKTYSCKGIHYLSNTLWNLPCLWLKNCFPHWLLSCSSSKTYLFLHIFEFVALHIQFFWHFLLGDILSCCWIIVTFFFVQFGLHVWHVRLIGTSCITSERINFETIVIRYDYWRFSIYYVTRTSFRNLSILQSSYGVQKEENVVTNAYPIFVQYVIIPWIATVKLTEVSILFHIWSRVSEMLKAEVLDYIPLIILYVHVSFSLRKVVSTEVAWNVFPPAIVSLLGTNLVEFPLWNAWIIGVHYRWTINS